MQPEEIIECIRRQNFIECTNILKKFNDFENVRPVKSMSDVAKTMENDDGMSLVKHNRFLTFMKKTIGKQCKKCESLKPPGSHHCSTCEGCVARMDHHCPWVNNCVGYNNHKYFL